MPWDKRRRCDLPLLQGDYIGEGGGYTSVNFLKITFQYLTLDIMHLGADSRRTVLPVSIHHSTARVDLLDTPVRTGAKRRSTPRKRGAKTRTQNARNEPFVVFHKYKLEKADFSSVCSKIYRNLRAILNQN